ncbi:cell wall-binding repeat-containing protein [Clostridium sp. PL3]|uniref:Cell wall-binding repeat-containing protein n=2 Tax=Clostridium thailandense TaxID=2794346 RepID=A0A949WPM2_9CLOT|nr:cell wall-binding repeat-containing protein [Clostridium thailandense]
MPILLTDKDTFSEDTKKFLSDNSIEKAYIIGGSGVISDNVAKNYPSPERVWGIDRYETNLNVINRFNGTEANKVYVASGENFPDALSGAALAGKDSSFIVLTSTSPEKAARSLVYNVSKKTPDTNNVIILGGTGVVSDNVVKQLTTKDLDFTGNVINGGTVIYDNGNTYYYNVKKAAFNQLSTNGTVKKVAETSAKALNVVGNTAYYVKNFSAEIPTGRQLYLL